MRVWLTSFIVLFGAAELFQWVQHMSLPLPIFVLGGAFLAIASNYDKLSNLPFHLDYKEPEAAQKEMSSNQPPKAVQAANPTNPPPRPISFEIRKPFNPRD